MSCICGYLHFTRDLEYEFFYLSQYILQFIIYIKLRLSFMDRSGRGDQMVTRSSIQNKLEIEYLVLSLRGHIQYL